MNPTEATAIAHRLPEPTPDGEPLFDVLGQPPELRPEHVEAIAAAANASHSAATRRNYRAALGRFADWLHREYPHSRAVPATPEAVAAYLAERAQSVGAASVRMDRAAIGFAHREAGFADPTASAGVQRVLRGISRTASKRSAPRQAGALTAEAMAAIRATAHLPRTGPTGRRESKEAAGRRAVVDVALAATVRDALLRRSEAAALRWADIEFRSDGSGRVTVRRSKTDQEAVGAVQYVGPSAATALRALRRLQGSDVSEGARVFGLRSGRSISNRLAAMGRAAGIDGLTGHSGRVGMARDLVASGASVSAVQVAGRWKSARMPAHYARAELAGRGAVASYYGR